MAQLDPRIILAAQQPDIPGAFQPALEFKQQRQFAAQDQGRPEGGTGGSVRGRIAGSVVALPKAADRRGPDPEAEQIATRRMN